MNLRYAVVFGRMPNNYGAYPPDVPGCVSTGATRAQIRDNIREALCFHVEGVVESGEAPPEPRMSVKEAMAYHSQPREEVVETIEPAVDLPTTVEMVEIVLPQSVFHTGRWAGAYCTANF